MKNISTLVVLVFLVCCGQVAIAGGWGPTFAIELSGDGLAKPLGITEPSILEGLSLWVGPGTGMRDFMAPNGSEKSIVNWSAGVVTDHPAGLQRVEVKFRVGRSSEYTAAFFVLYERDPGGSTGYIYYPTINGIVSHSSEGTWRYASDRWNEMVGPIINEHTITGIQGEFQCQLQAYKNDGGDLFIVTPTLKTFEATQEAAYWETVFGPIVPGKTAKRSCWPDSRDP